MLYRPGFDSWVHTRSWEVSQNFRLSTYLFTKQKAVYEGVSMTLSIGVSKGFL